MDEDAVGEGVGDVELVAAGAANSAPRYLALCLKPKAARVFLETASPLLSLRSLERDDLSGPGRFRHGQPQLTLAGDGQHAVVVFDHVAQGLQVALDTRWPTMNFIRMRSLITPPPSRACAFGSSFIRRL